MPLTEVSSSGAFLHSFNYFLTYCKKLSRCPTVRKKMAYYLFTSSNFCIFADVSAKVQILGKTKRREITIN